MNFGGGAPITMSSHTGSKMDKVYRDALKDMTPQVLLPSPLGAMLPRDVNAPIKPNEATAFRGAVPLTQAMPPSNLMAGAPAPRPLSSAPQVPGGNMQSRAPPPMGGVSTGLTSTARPMPKPMSQATGQVPLKGTLKITVPFDTKNKPIFSQIKDIFFVPSTPGPIPPLPKNGPALVTMKPGALPPTPPLMKQPGAPAVTPGGAVKPPPVVAPGKPPVVAPGKPPIVAPGKPPVVAPGKPPVVAPGKPPVVAPGKPPAVAPVTLAPAIAPPRVFLGRKRVRTYPDGRKVIISRGRAVTIYPNGQQVIMRRGPLGRMIKTTVSPNGTRVIKRGNKTITIQPDGRRVIVTRGILGKTRTVVKGPRRR